MTIFYRSWNPSPPTSPPATAPQETAAYKKIGEMLAQTGYVNSIREATRAAV
jgi:hypothetical protein